MKLSGSELFELVENREPPSMVTKMGRLRLGYCAREGCQSYDYRVILRNHPPYDWPQMVATITQLRQKTPERRLSTESFRNLYFDLAHSRTFLRLAMAFAVGVMVTLAWQWHRGGRIPILREPEEFQVAPMPAPAGAEDNSVD